MELPADDIKLLKETYLNPLWRLSHLYYIKDKEGKKVLFKPNWMQQDVLSNHHPLLLVLKARQLGSTTLAILRLMDSAIFSSVQDDKTMNCGIIAHRREDAENIFYEKVKFAYDNLPDFVKDMNKARNDTARELRFSDGSSIRVSTSLRSGTYQKILVTEFAKLCRANPLAADEVISGTLQTVAKDQEVIIESTAEGRSGHFFELCEKYRKLAESGKELSPMDMKFLFYPWHKHPDYVLFDPIDPDRETNQYFDELEAKHGITLRPEQKVWYFKKKETLREQMMQEYPSTPEEAFAEGIEGYYYSKDMANLRKLSRLTKVPYDPATEVHTAWDLGIDDATAIWFFQVVGQEIHLIDYYENNGESLAHYANYLKDKHSLWPNLSYGRHILPHDVEQRELSTNTTRKKTLEELGVKVTVAPKTPIPEGIHAVRMMLPRCYFDEKACSTGIKHIEAYRKDFSSKYGVFTDKPFHGSESHACDSLRYLAVGLPSVEKGKGMTEAEARELENKHRFRY